MVTRSPRTPAVEAEIVAPSAQLDVAVLARQDRVAADEDAIADAIPVVSPFAVDGGAVSSITNDCLPMWIYLWVAQRHVSGRRRRCGRRRPSSSEVERFHATSAEARRPRLRRDMTTSSYLQSGAEPGPADDQRRRIMARLDAPGAKRLVLRLVDRRALPERLAPPGVGSVGSELSQYSGTQFNAADPSRRPDARREADFRARTRDVEVRGSCVKKSTRCDRSAARRRAARRSLARRAAA
jgi:hypothetical protein